MHPGVEESTPRVEVSLVTAHGLAALVTLLASLAFGIVAAIELLFPDLFGGVSWLSWGRVRYAHTQGVILGWLGNVFFAFLYHAVPILAGRRVTSALLGRWLFARAVHEADLRPPSVESNEPHAGEAVDKTSRSPEVAASIQ